jgi:hypothetical protein
MSKRTFEVVFLFVAAACLSVPGVGQENRQPTFPAPAKPAFNLGDLSRELKLTAAQQAADAPLIESERAQAAALWQKADAQIQSLLGLKHPGYGGDSPNLERDKFVPGVVASGPSVKSEKWVGFVSDHIAKTLKLNRDQQAKIEPPVVDLRRGLLDLHEKTIAQISNGLDREQRDKFKSLADKYDPPFYNLAAFCCPQASKNENSHQPRETAGQHSVDRAPNSIKQTPQSGLRLDVLTKELKLTAAQQAAIDPFIESERSQSAVLWKNAGTQIQSVLPTVNAANFASNFGPDKFVPGVNSTPAVRSQQWVGFISNQLAKTLKLTRNQHAATEPSLVELQRGLLDLHERTIAQINKVLDREQRDRFKSLDLYPDPLLR